MQRTFITLGLVAAALLSAASTALAADSPAPAAASRPAPSIEELLGDPVLARGKGFEIKRSRLDEAVSKYQAQLIEQGSELPPAQVPEAQAALMDFLIQTIILNQQATPDQKARGEAEAEKRLARLKKYLVTDDAFIRRMRAMNTTPEIFRQRLTEDSIRTEVLRDRFHVSDEELKKYYNEHPTEFMDADKARVGHILLLTVDLKLNRPLSDDQKDMKRQKMEGILKRARAGEDFSKLAREFSEDPDAKANGGVINITRGAPGVPREFDAAAFTLKNDQISDIIASSMGFHIIKMIELTPGKKADLAATTVDLRNFLEDRAAKKAEPKFMEELKKQYAVEILDPEIKRIQADLKFPSISLDNGTNSLSGLPK